MNRPSYSPFFAISLYLLYDHRGIIPQNQIFLGIYLKNLRTRHTTVIPCLTPLSLPGLTGQSHAGDYRVKRDNDRMLRGNDRMLCERSLPLRSIAARRLAYRLTTVAPQVQLDTYRLHDIHRLDNLFFILLFKLLL